MKRTLRKLLSLVAIAAVLFTQLAVSAHACPMMATDMAESPCQEMMASADQPMDPPGLCHKHCQNEQQNLGNVDYTAAPVLLPATFVIPMEPAAPAALPVTSPALQHPISPPLPIRHCSLRI